MLNQSKISAETKSILHKYKENFTLAEKVEIENHPVKLPVNLIIAVSTQ